MPVFAPADSGEEVEGADEEADVEVAVGSEVTGAPTVADSVGAGVEPYIEV